MEKSFTYEQLIEKMVIALAKLASLRRKHSDTCLVELDPNYMGPCRCGATEHNANLGAARAALKIG